MEKETSKIEILEAINTFATKIDGDINGLKDGLAGLKKELKDDINSIKSQMVTKDYLDEKMSDLRGDLVVLVRKEDTKVKKLIDVLQKKNVLSEQESKEIMSMEPFPQLAL